MIHRHESADNTTQQRTSVSFNFEVSMDAGLFRYRGPGGVLAELEDQGPRAIR